VCWTAALEKSVKRASVELRFNVDLYRAKPAEVGSGLQWRIRVAGFIEEELREIEPAGLPVFGILKGVPTAAFASAEWREGTCCPERPCSECESSGLKHETIGRQVFHSCDLISQRDPA